MVGASLPSGWDNDGPSKWVEFEIYIVSKMGRGTPKFVGKKKKITKRGASIGTSHEPTILVLNSNTVRQSSTI